MSGNEKRAEARNKSRTLTLKLNGDRKVSRSTGGGLNPDANRGTYRLPGYSNDLEIRDGTKTGGRKGGTNASEETRKKGGGEDSDELL